MKWFEGFTIGLLLAILIQSIVLVSTINGLRDELETTDSPAVVELEEPAESGV